MEWEHGTLASISECDAEYYTFIASLHPYIIVVTSVPIIMFTVLPKFEVTVVLPSYGTADMTSLKGSVIAKYVFTLVIFYIVQVVPFKGFIVYFLRYRVLYHMRTVIPYDLNYIVRQSEHIEFHKF